MNIKRHHLLAGLAATALIITGLLLMRSCSTGNSESGNDAPRSLSVFEKVFSRETRTYSDGMTDSGLSAEERAENEKEIALMRKTLPGNTWIPYDMTESEQKAQREQMKESIMLENKMRRGTATLEEKRRYYENQIKSTQDRIDLLEYYMKRTAELTKETGREYYSKEDLAVGQESIEEFKDQIADYRNKLEELK